jgi:hypothetical protein
MFASGATANTSDPSRGTLDISGQPGEEASMNAKEIERAAYLAAHRILIADTSTAELGAAGARRKHAVDTIAAIIQDAFKIHVIGPKLVQRRPAAVVIELPRRASSFRPA